MKDKELLYILKNLIFFAHYFVFKCFFTNHEMMSNKKASHGTGLVLDRNA